MTAFNLDTPQGRAEYQIWLANHKQLDAEIPMGDRLAYRELLADRLARVVTDLD